MVVDVPRTGVVGGVGADVPAAAMPVHVDRAKHGVLVADIEGVPLVLRQLLSLHLAVDFGQGCLDFLFPAELLDDGSIHRPLLQAVAVDRARGHGLLDFPVVAQEPRREVATEARDLRLGLVAGVADELHLRVERLGGRRADRGGDELEDRLRGRFRRLCGDGDPARLFAHELVEFAEPFFTDLGVDEIGDELDERSEYYPERSSEHVEVHGQNFPFWHVVPF